MPGPETRLWLAVREWPAQGHHFRRQAQIGPYYLDFLCHGSKLVIEVDGDTNFMGNRPTYDRCRDQRIVADGFRVTRYTKREVVTNPDGVLEAISLALAKPTLHPSQKGEGDARTSGSADEEAAV